MKKKDKIISMLEAISFGAGREQSESAVQGSDGSDRKTKARKPSFTQRLQDHLSAVAYAEAGEFESAKEMIEHPQTAKTVLLVIEGEAPDPKAFHYALNLCKRTAAELDILQVICKSESEPDYDTLSRKMSEASKNLVELVRRAEEREVPFKVTMRLGDVSQKLFNYAKRHRDVGIVVFDSPRAKTAPKKDRGWHRFVENVSRELSIPLITVFEGR
jgi:hypothetical protein